MQQLFNVVGISRQAFHQQRQAKAQRDGRIKKLLHQVRLERQNHPSMGARSIYQMWQLDPEKRSFLDGFGRDQFEAILLENGYRVRHVIAYHRTTHPGTYRFENLIAGKSFNDVNQLWASDITYFRIDAQFVYITVILDLYSRKCLAAVCSSNMTAEKTVIAALKCALKERKGMNLKDCIFHSDAGAQYIDKLFLKLIQQNGMISSMANSCYENPHAEKFHDIIKNDYLYQWNPTHIPKLPSMVQKFIHLYNNQKPHSALGGIPPSLFEQQNHKTKKEKTIPLVISPFCEQYQKK